MTTLSPEEFERAVEEALDSLPDELAGAIDNLEIGIEDEDADEPDIYGIYLGVPLTERGSDYFATLPDRILIYQRPLEQDFGHDRGELVEQIRITVLHEIAHHFGIDDARLTELGWA